MCCTPPQDLPPVMTPDFDQGSSCSDCLSRPRASLALRKAWCGNALGTNSWVAGGLGRSLRAPHRGFGPPWTGPRLRCSCLLFSSSFVFLFRFRPEDADRIGLHNSEHEENVLGTPTRDHLLAGIAWLQWSLALDTPGLARNCNGLGLLRPPVTASSSP